MTGSPGNNRISVNMMTDVMMMTGMAASTRLMMNSRAYSPLREATRARQVAVELPDPRFLMTAAWRE